MLNCRVNNVNPLLLSVELLLVLDYNNKPSRKGFVFHFHLTIRLVCSFSIDFGFIDCEREIVCVSLTPQLMYELYFVFTLFCPPLKAQSLQYWAFPRRNVSATPLYSRVAGSILGTNCHYDTRTFVLYIHGYFISISIILFINRLRFIKQLNNQAYVTGFIYLILEAISLTEAMGRSATDKNKYTLI